MQWMWRFIDTLLEHGPQLMVGSDCFRFQQKAKFDGIAGQH